MSLNAPGFGQWLGSGAGAGPDGRDFTVRLGKAWLSLPAGRVVAAEPAAAGTFGDDPRAFTQTVAEDHDLWREYHRTEPRAGSPGSNGPRLARFRLSPVPHADEETGHARSEMAGPQGTRQQR
jgi:alkanesulfonate monooxygenase SsuD/methylene tetrahydromethanopterin reductase-like flavin-dependent oxidoreductase (luciferase family)